MQDSSLHVLLQVQGKMVTARKGSFAEFARVRSDPRVLPDVPSKLVRPGELPATTLPAAHVRLLPRVAAQVRLHVAGLVVRLATRLVRTTVHYWNFSDRPSLSLGAVLQAGGGVVGGGGEVQANPGTARIQFRRRPLREARCPRRLLVWVVLVLGTIGELPSMLHHFMFHAL